MTEQRTAETLRLAEVADQLIADLPNHPAGRAARTIVSGLAMRAVVIALRQGTELAEHDSPAAATLYCIKGSVTLRTNGRDWPLAAGELVPIPPRRHSVVAHEDAALMLTVALR
jgi:quercetin dioxygenase-like cupin family protein